VPWLRLSGKRMSSPNAWAAALGEEDVFPECLSCGSRGRGCLPRVLHSGKIFFKKKEMTSAATNGVNSSPSAWTALGEAFPEYTIFGSRGRRLSRKEIPRELFPECCTRGRLPRVQLGLPRVLLTLGEAAASCSGRSIAVAHPDHVVPVPWPRPDRAFLLLNTQNRINDHLK